MSRLSHLRRKETNVFNQNYFCGQCKVKFTDLVQLQRHFMGADHQSRLANQAGGFRFNVWCHLCNCDLQGINMDKFNMHIRISKHMKLLEPPGKEMIEEVCPFCFQVFDQTGIKHHQVIIKFGSLSYISTFRWLIFA